MSPTKARISDTPAKKPTVARPTLSSVPILVGAAL